MHRSFQYKLVEVSSFLVFGYTESTGCPLRIRILFTTLFLVIYL